MHYLPAPLGPAPDTGARKGVKCAERAGVPRKPSSSSTVKATGRAQVACMFNMNVHALPCSGSSQSLTGYLNPFG